MFSQFGGVVNVTIPTEKETQKKRAFGFVEFDDYDSVDKACCKFDLKFYIKISIVINYC